jgi:Holliday junction resolvase-like predicted endonuclease
MTTNHQAGHDAEQRAADYLASQGFEVVELNWKTRYCEIDIVAKKAKTIYLVEVKSRKNSYFGSGFDYITPKKLGQMRFAAEMWVQNHSWSGDYRLAALSVDASNCTFIDEL